ncbi:hypothetical protein GCM10027082_29420 [Comamonas humi]
MYPIPWRSPVLRLTALASATAAAAPAWAQEAMCQISLGYGPLVTSPPPAPSPVPGMGMVAIGLLTATVGVVAWHKSRAAGRNGRQFLSAALLASAGLLLAHGSDSLAQAARAYELSDPKGGTLAYNDIPAADPAPLITVTNTSGVRLRITSNDNAAETGSCTVDAELAPNGTCTTQAVCPPPPVAPPPPAAEPPPPPPPPPQSITVTSDPEVACDTSQALYTVEWQSSDGLSGSSYSVYGPVISKQPVFDPDSPPPDVGIAYPERLRLTLDANGRAQNLAEATAYTATVTATAPEGRGFGDPPQPTTDWRFSFAGDSENSGGGGGGGGGGGSGGGGENGACYSTTRYESL